jgi:hypothetical protein
MHFCVSDLGLAVHNYRNVWYGSVRGVDTAVIIAEVYEENIWTSQRKQQGHGEH